jgi:signal transduction histidine kinase
MNRLWVRLSLAFAGVIIIVSLVAGLGFYMNARDYLGAEAEAPPEVQAYFEQIRRDNRPFNALPAIIVVGAVAVGAGVWMSRSLSAPLREMEEAAGAIGRQELSTRLSPHGSQEMIAVSSAFNDMAAQLEEADSLRQNLLADVAHELRHPIHILQGNLQAMLDDVYPLNKEEIARLSDQARLLTALVDDLRILAQAEAHQLRLEKSATDMAALVKDAASGFKPLVAAKDIEMRVELLGAMPIMEVDPGRMRQVLGNLLGNALLHTPDGGAITVCAEQKESTFLVSVTDSGSGIAAEDLPHVFDRFYRADPARSRDAGGSGLGLAIAQAIVAEHGGEITASSAGPGQGSTLIIYLPISL